MTSWTKKEPGIGPVGDDGPTDPGTAPDAVSADRRADIGAASGGQGVTPTRIPPAEQGRTAAGDDGPAKYGPWVDFSGYGEPATVPPPATVGDREPGEAAEARRTAIPSAKRVSEQARYAAVRAEELTNLRSAAAGWMTAVTGIQAVVFASLAFSADGVRGVPDSLLMLVATLTICSLAFGLAAILLLAGAAYGPVNLEERVAIASESLTERVIDKRAAMVVRRFRLGRALFFLSIVCFTSAVVTTWFAR
jgi:hypothetical protein